MANTSAHQLAETEVLHELNKRFKCNMEARRVRLEDCYIEADGYDERGFLCEIYARQSAISSDGHRKKVARDLLKMKFVKDSLQRELRLIYAVTTEEAMASLQNASWLASAFRFYNIELHLVELSETSRHAVMASENTSSSEGDYGVNKE